MTPKGAVCVPRNATSTRERANYARPFWDAATRYGEPGATTTFHDQFNKNDCYWDADRRQRGDRCKALGYLTLGRFTRWLGTESGRQVTGVDCSHAGRNAAREQRVRRIAMEFFALAVRLSKECEIRRGDVEAVAQVRSVNVGTFCLFPGFTEALLSYELRDLSAAWRAAEAAEAAPAAAPTPNPESPRVPTPDAESPRVPTPDAELPTCQLHSPAAPPSPTKIPAAPQSPSVDCVVADPRPDSCEGVTRPSGDDLHSLAASALVAALNDFGEAERLAPSLAFGATGCRTYAQTSLYEVRVKRVSRTRSGRAPYECCVLLRGVLKRGARNTVLRSVEEIKEAFSRKNLR